MAKWNTITDDFPGSALGALWIFTAGTPTVASNIVTINEGDSAYTDYHDLSDSSVTFKWDHQRTGGYAACYVYDGSANVATMYVVPGDGPALWMDVASVSSHVSAANYPYDPEDNIWWRIRHASDVIYFETSADGITFTTRDSQTLAAAAVDVISLGFTAQGSGSGDTSLSKLGLNPEEITGTAVTAITATITADGTVEGPPPSIVVTDTGVSANSDSAVTTVDLVLTGLTVGDLLVIHSAADNSGTNGAARTCTPTNQSGTAAGTFSSYQQNADPGSSAAGTTVNLILAEITATSGTVRLTYSGSVVQACKVFTVSGVVNDWPYAVGTVGGGTATNNTTLASVADASVADENLVWGFVAVEGPGSDTYTNDSDTTNGSWTATTKLGTANGTAASNQTVYSAYKQVTATGAQTWNPTIGTARDSAALILELAKASGATVTGTAVTSITATITAVGTKEVFGAAATTIAATSTAVGTKEVFGTAATDISATITAVGTKTVFGAAVTNIVAFADAIGVEITSGTALTAITATATAVGTKTVFGSAATPVAALASAVGTRSTFGTAATSIAATATAIGTNTVTGTAATSITATATAVGVPTVFGAAVTSIAATATAVGSSFNVVSGVAATDIAASATAVGTKEVFGSSAASITATATAVGSNTVFGQASTDIVAAATAVGFGVNIITGEAATNITATATAVGTKTVFGSAATSVVASITAAGTSTVLGAAATSVAAQATAVGTKTVFGAAASSVTVVATAVGVKTVFGAAATSIAVSATALGVEVTAGVALTTITVSATAVGTRTVLGVAATSVSVTATAVGTKTVFGTAVTNITAFASANNEGGESLTSTAAGTSTVTFLLTKVETGGPSVLSKSWNTAVANFVIHAESSATATTSLVDAFNGVIFERAVSVATAITATVDTLNGDLSEQLFSAAVATTTVTDTALRIFQATVTVRADTIVNTVPPGIGAVVDPQREFFGPSGQISRRVDIFNADGSLWMEDVPILSGTVTVDSTRPERRAFELELDNESGVFDSSPDGFWYDKRIRISRGVRDSTGTQMYPLGEFLPDKITNTFAPITRVTGRDRTKLLKNSKYSRATAYSPGLAVGAVVAGIAAAAGETRFNVPTNAEVLSTDFFYDAGVSRWDAAKQIAEAFGYEVFYDQNAIFTMRKFVDPSTSPTSFTFLTGRDGNLAGYEKSTEDSQIFNDVVVTGATSAGIQVYGQAENNEPTSPTRIGRLGRRTWTYDAKLITTTQQANDLALGFLKIMALESYELTMEALVAPWLDAGTVVEFVDPRPVRGAPNKFLLTALTIPLALGVMTASARRLTIVG